MSTIGLPMNGHVRPHFDSGGFCHCPCGECSSRPAGFCFCLDCPCDAMSEHYANVTRRIALFGTCEVCELARDVVVREAGGGELAELWCYACAASR